MTRPDPQRHAVLDRLKARGPATRIAVVGASNHPEKYGNIIVRNLAAKGYTVLPINPKEQEIAGLRAYAALRDCPPPLHVVDFVTPPAVTLAVLREAEGSGVEAVFLQDGSWDQAVLDYLATTRIAALWDACIMVVT